MDSFLAELQAEGITDSRGTFTMDARLARRKMASFQLPDPASYVLKIVQAAVASRATRLEVKSGREVLTMAFTSQDPDLADTAIVGGAVLRLSSLRRSALKHLAVGLNAACAAATEIRWDTPRGSLILTAEGLGVAEGSSPDLRLTVRKKRSLFQWFMGPPFWEEMRRLTESCGYAPLELVIDGLEIPRAQASHLGGVAQDHFGLSDMAPLLEGLQPGTGLRVLLPDLNDYQSLGDKRWARRSGKEGPLILEGWEGEMTSEARAVLSVTTATSGRGTWQPVLDGVCLKAISDDTGHPAATVVFDAEQLQTDFSEFRLVRDEEFAKRLAELRQVLRTLTEAITPGELERALVTAGLDEVKVPDAVARLHQVLQTHQSGQVQTIRELVQVSFRDRKNVYLAPNIPADKAANATAVHTDHLPPGEPLLVLYDDTLFGSAKEGFVITESRLCWKSLMYSPAFLLWEELPFLEPQQGVGKVTLRGDQEISATSHEIVGTLFEFLGHAQAVAPEPEPRPEVWGAIIRSGLSTLGKSFNVGYHPYIKEAWLRQIQSVYGSIWAPDDVPLVAYDDTLLGKADDGWVATATRLYWKPVFSDPQCLLWGEIKADSVEVSSVGFRIGDHEVHAHLSALRPAMVSFVRSVAGVSQ